MSELATPTRATPALAIDGLTYSYPTRTAGPRDVSLHLAPGEFALLAGRSASGKSTLLRAACGLVPHFHGGEIEGSSRRSRHRRDRVTARASWPPRSAT